MSLKNKYNQTNFIFSNAYPQNVNQVRKGVGEGRRFQDEGVKNEQSLTNTT